MKVSHFFFKTLREAPNDATLPSHALMLRGGYIRQVAAGVYSLTPLGLRVIRNIENIIRREMNAIGGQEVSLPLVQPAELWRASGRYDAIGNELLRFQDRTGHDMVLAMTHEEAVTDLAAHCLTSYKQMPFMLYQFQLKYRDEPRARGGLIRQKEFLMKDAYSFHADEKDLDRYYESVYKAYLNIFRNVNINPVVVQSDTGIMGGKVAHEFMLETEHGEDYLILCRNCGYQANQEIALFQRGTITETPLPLQKVATPNRTSIADVSEFLGIDQKRTLKCVFYQNSANELFTILLRGDLDVSEIKLKNHLRVQEVFPAEPQRIIASRMVPGYASAAGAQNTRIIADTSVLNNANMVTGANEEGFHVKNFNPDRDIELNEIADLALATSGAACPECGNRLDAARGIELGNIFKLGTTFSKRMGCEFLNTQGKTIPAVMGCYGIGVGRLAAAIIENSHDDWGIIWPDNVAPFQALICQIGKDAAVENTALQLYADLQSAGLDVLYDDREERPGVKFKDADLWGIPVRIAVGAKALEKGMVEWKLRAEKKYALVDKNTVVSKVLKYFERR